MENIDLKLGKCNENITTFGGYYTPSYPQKT